MAEAKRRQRDQSLSRRVPIASHVTRAEAMASGGWGALQDGPWVLESCRCRVRQFRVKKRWNTQGLAGRFSWELKGRNGEGRDHEA